MRENIYLYSKHTHIFFILSLFLLWFNTTAATSLGNQLVAVAGGAANTCIDKERQTLLDLKHNLQDPNDWLSTWRPDEEYDCCQWFGVRCDNQTGHVTDLELYGCGLVGEISLSLLNLTYLNYLDLSQNFLYGTICEFIHSMTHLTYLNLRNNEFTGTIPESIRSLTKLTTLGLGGNNFSGIIPETIGFLTKLTKLDLSSNKLHGTIPMSIGYLTKLTSLNLAADNFSGFIPRSIGSLTKLEYFYLSANSFYGTIPTEFGNLTQLNILDLDSLGSCRVENFDWLSSLSHLGGLYMDGISLAKANNWLNVIIGLQNLSYVSLKGCDLSQVTHPYSLSVNSSSSMYSLSLDNNNLNSSMFPWLCPLFGDRLARLYLSSNKFDGKLSDFLNNLSGCISSTLWYLDASSNQFTGSLPDEIHHFSSLDRLNLSYNKLNGTISDKLWQLPLLTELDVSSNSLRGAISKNIGKSNIWYIDLSYNSLEGALSNDDVSSLSQSIQYIDFSSNKLGPRFPKWIQKLKNLAHLGLSNNNISDTIPAAFSGSLSFLDLSRNKFQGEISILCQIYGKIEFLDLSQNSLTGKLQDCLKNLTYLKVLNLGYNALSGSIPPYVGYVSQLEMLCLYNNNFSGELPLSLKNCSKLTFLDVGGNNLYGTIPVWIGKSLSRLYALSLKSNNFFGTIPSQICELVSLQILDLSFNNLRGKIPSCLNNLTSMVKKEFVLENNKRPYLGILILAGGFYSHDNTYIDRMLIEWQGKVTEFSSILGLLKVIDLSSNNLRGKIPNEVTNLQGLVVLDFSNNSLVGEIPRNIGHMTELLTLNLSRNMFSGTLPSSMSDMHLLNDLDVSFNNLSGRVPSSTQLQSFPSERFTGNVGLCGHPTTKKCLEDEDQGVPPIGDSKGDAESTDEFQKWFYIGGGTGFATAFWIACSALLFNRRLRHAFFHLHHCLKDWVYVTVVVFIARLQRAGRA